MNQSPVFMNRGDDPEMLEANRRARQTFRYFYRELCWEGRRIIPGLDVACVKVVFEDPPELADPDRGAEVMWVSDVTFDGLKVYGTLINQPNWLRSVKEGDAVQIAPKELADWMYAIAGQVFGGFTVQLMRSRMGRSERAAHDSAWGMDFGSPNEVHVVPPSFCRPATGFFGKMLGKGNAPLTQEELENTDHPMAKHMADSLAENLAKSPEAIQQTDDRGFTLLHQMALAGSASCCDVLLRHRANPNALAPNGMTPLRLAKSLGWKQVVQLLEQRGAR